MGFLLHSTLWLVKRPEILICDLRYEKNSQKNIPVLYECCKLFKFHSSDRHLPLLQPALTWFWGYDTSDSAPNFVFKESTCHLSLTWISNPNVSLSSFNIATRCLHEEHTEFRVNEGCCALWACISTQNSAVPTIAPPCAWGVSLWHCCLFPCSSQRSQLHLHVPGAGYHSLPRTPIPLGPAKFPGHTFRAE